MSEEPATTASSPLDHVLARESAAHVDRALALLSDKEREAIVLYYRGDESLAAVAAALGISEAAAKKRVLRGRAHLREAGREVEATLQRTRPTAAFTAGCVAALVAGAGAKASAGTLGSTPVRSVGSKLAIGGAIAALALGTAVWAIHRDPPPTDIAAIAPPVIAPAASLPRPVASSDPAPKHDNPKLLARAPRIASLPAPAATPRAAPSRATATGSDADFPKIARVRTFDFSGGPLAVPIPGAPPRPLPALVDKRELREAIRVVQPLVRDCYDREGQGVHGTLQLVVRLEGEPGSSMIATAAKLEGELASNADLAECVKQALLSIELPPLDIGGAYEVMYPFTV
jgi:biotin operon repressor